MPDATAPIEQSSVPPAGGTTEEEPLIATVWCRQVDNEAESPGYSAIPEEFPGHRETLEAIRVIGNLTINVADTHDYWDPDPDRSLSFYSNLFLYPAYGGRYTCIGRMFLSTEDRPRLGMKTVILDSAKLLSTGEFGTAVLRWHASLAPAPGEDHRRPTEPNPDLVATIGEGFLFHRGSTDPVLVLVTSDQWESAVSSILDLLAQIPAPLVALGAILLFPYFLPQAKTNLHELTEEIPLALALMRVPRTEAHGDLHERRLSSWETAPVTVRDLTRGIPAARAKDSVPLILQYVRDRQEAKLAPVAQRVDLVESPRLLERLTDPDRQAGKDRRKEMWRIGTAMESAALLLQRPRGRQIPMSAETAKRAHEYLKARPGERSEPTRRSAVTTPTGTPLGDHHPPWLQRRYEEPARPDRGGPVPGFVGGDTATGREELVPTPSASAPTATALMEARSNDPPIDDRSPSGIDPLRESIIRDLTRIIDERLEDARERSVEREGADSTWVGIVETRLANLSQELFDRIDQRATDEERRAAERLAAATATIAAEQATLIGVSREEMERHLFDGAEAQTATWEAFRREFQERMAATEAQLSGLDETVEQEVERHMALDVGPRISQVDGALRTAMSASGDLLRQQLHEELNRSVEELWTRSERSKEELRAALSEPFGLELSQLNDREATLQEKVELLTQRFQEMDQRRAKELRDVDLRLALAIDTRAKDLDARYTALLNDHRARFSTTFDGRLSQLESRLTEVGEVRTNDLQDARSEALAELQVRMQSYVDQKLRENQQQELDKYLELLARLKSEVDAALGKVIDPGRLDSVLRERLQKGTEAQRAEQQKFLEQKVVEAEVRMRTASDERVARLERVESKVQQRESDLLRLERTIRTEMEELERRTQVLSERLLPVVRKAWTKIGEIEKTVGDPQQEEVHTRELRREFARELRRVEGQYLEQTAELRDRIESAISSQGRVWLTLVQQLSQLTSDRRAIEGVGGEPGMTRGVNGYADLPRSPFSSKARASREPPMIADDLAEALNEAASSEDPDLERARRRMRRAT